MPQDRTKPYSTLRQAFGPPFPFRGGLHFCTPMPHAARSNFSATSILMRVCPTTPSRAASRSTLSTIKRRKSALTRYTSGPGLRTAGDCATARNPRMALTISIMIMEAL